MNIGVQDLFHQLADLTAEERTRYFAEHHVEEQVRAEVEALLQFDAGASLALERDIALAAGQALTEIEAGLEKRCGPYRLLEIVGRGGMGAVYLAERVDGEVTQRVAIKLLGAASGDPLRRERFLKERQILASVTHPNIARMLDAGHLADGQPFLAMEFVEGKRIDAFASGLSVRQKVTLFLKVCAAVGYLHRNLVVHRDLKPSNILVTPEGEPKLLDFGIAKILDLSTDLTMTGMRMLTPDYASPEQVMGGRVSTATDIYSLGAVLYLLLTGKPAHEFADHSPEAIAAAITTREVTRPAKMAPELKGDLEAILLKALRKDPQERYATVEQFAEDLNAFLESRPVRARAGSAWYHTRKFLRRYWVPVIAATLVIASLSVGLYVANRQRVLAESRFGQLRQLSNRVFDVDAELGGLPGTVNARIKIISAVTQYLEGLGGEALRDRELALEAATAYLRIARVQGVPEWNMLGLYAEAEESLRKADMVIDPLLAAEPRNRGAILLSANIAHDRAVVAYALRRPEQVLAHSPKVFRRFDQLIRTVRIENLTQHELNQAAYIYGDLSEVHIALHRFDDAARYARRGIEISRYTPTLPGPRAQAFNMLAGSLMGLGDFEGALEAVREARKLLASFGDIMAPLKIVEDAVGHKQISSRYPRLILHQSRCREGLILGEDGGVNLGKPLEAAVAFRQAFDAVEEVAAKEPNDFETRACAATAGRYLGNVLRHGNPRAALDIYDRSLIRIREVNHDVTARREEAYLLAGSSYAARSMHRDNDARARIEAAFRLLHETGDYPAGTIRAGSEADTTVRALADHYAETGESGKAVEAYQELRSKVMASNPDPQNDLPNAAAVSGLDAALAPLLRRVGRPGEAAALEENRRALWRHWERKLPNHPFVLQQLAAKPKV